MLHLNIHNSNFQLQTSRVSGNARCQFNFIQIKKRLCRAAGHIPINVRTFYSQQRSLNIYAKQLLQDHHVECLTYSYSAICKVQHGDSLVIEFHNAVRGFLFFKIIQL